jgi:hypothetical protein
MQIVALMSWYDEPPQALRAMIGSLTTVPVSRLVALDGAYRLYPDGQNRSSSLQHAAIIQACQHHGIELTNETPATVWHGNEIEKRNRLFELAEQVTGPDDWYMVIDADEQVLTAPQDTSSRLAGSPFDVAGITLREPGHPLGTIVFDTFPMFFRAIPGIRCHQDHFTYRTPDGRNLWGDAKRTRLEPRLDLTDLVVEHRNQLRHPDRRRAAVTYYDRRDEAGIEELPELRSLLTDEALAKIKASEQEADRRVLGL